VSVAPPDFDIVGRALRHRRRLVVVANREPALGAGFICRVNPLGCPGHRSRSMSCPDADIRPQPKEIAA